MRKSIVSFSENELNIQRMTYHSVLLEFLDSIYSSIVIAPLIVFYWRGTWNLSEIYLYPHKKIQSSVASLLIGIAGHLVFTIWQRTFEKYLDANRHRMLFYIGSRLYTAIFGIICVNCWRGGWQLIDHYTARDMTTISSITILAILALMALKSLRNIVATPFVIITDQKLDYFRVPTKYKTMGTKETGLFIMDCLFSVLVIGSLVVVVWRGLWVIIDLKLYPDKPLTSAWMSMIIGYIIAGFTFSIQPIVKWSCDKLEGFWRIIVADAFLFMSLVGTVNVWRGIWQLLDHCFIPEHKSLSNWITHGGAFILLMLMNCCNTVLVRGVYIDGEEPRGECVVFPTHYIRLFFKKERRKKTIREKNEDAMMEKCELNHTMETRVKFNENVNECVENPSEERKASSDVSE